MKRFEGDTRRDVMTAIEISINVKKDINLRFNALRSLHENISVTSQYLECQTVTEALENIVLESGYANGNNWIYFHMKRYAFSCLEKIAAGRSDEFFLKYYAYLENQLSLPLSELPQGKNLQRMIQNQILFYSKYMNACDETEKFRILKTMSICISENACGVNLSIFKEFQSRDWCKELLTYTLLSNNKEWSANQTSKLTREINRLDIYLGKCNSSYCIGDVLEILITTQKTCELDIGFIIKVLKVLHTNESLDLLFKDFCFLPNVFSQLELFQFKQTCNDHKIIYTDENQIQKLQCLLLYYSDELIDIILSKVKPKTPITELIDFLQTVMEKDISRKEDFLLQLSPNGAIEDWKGELSLTSIKSFICQELPAWEYKTDIKSDFDKTYFLPVNAGDNSKCTTYAECNPAWKNDLRDAVSDENRKPLLHKLLYDLNHSLRKLMLLCKFSEATFKEIKTLIQRLDTETKIIQLINALEILIEYEINISQSDAIEIVLKSTEINVQRNIHSFIMKSTFNNERKEESVDQLIDQLVNREENITFLNNRLDLLTEYNKVMNAYNSKPVVNLGNIDLIKYWGEEEIFKWSHFIRLVRTAKRGDMSNLLAFAAMHAISVNKLSTFVSSEISMYERIAVIKRAMEVTTKVKLRDVQMLSVILLLNYQQNKGRLAQINTGEGKTIIIAMIAAYRALEGHEVDIITSSKLLAVPQSEQFKKFYSTLSLTVAHNFDSSEAYTANVLYGTSNRFQGDILRDEFRKSGRRHGRKCDVAIVDEVDNMLIDGNRHIVLLSSDMPAMDHLETILATIYAQVKAAAGSIVVKNGQSYFIERDNVFDENGARKDEYIENRVPIEGTMRDFIIQSTESHIRNLVRDCDAENLSSDFPEIKIPKHLREFICKTQLKKWIANAIAAKFNYVIKKDYILHDNRVRIVDANNTGVIKWSSNWCDGLHQFLEIKHGTNVTPESLTSNFISNVSFFRRYRPKIYGLSGTLGCQGTKKLLAKTYDLDFIIVPPFKCKQHKDLSPIIVNNREDWYREIVKSSLRKLCNGRAVLIIMEYINETEAVEKTFVDVFGYDKKKMKLYKTDNDSSVVDKPLDSGHVIITTNIAGRGTDIKLTKDVNDNGGLHVCITFLPKNSRVEEQNVGRTSRTGNPGTSQFILCNSETDIAKLRKNRYEKEETALRNAEKEIEIVTAKDEIFQKFCQLTDLINGRNTFVKKIEMTAVEERFAIWLKMHSDEIKDGSKSDFFKSFESFREDILRDDENGKLIRNPYMFVKIGNKYMDIKQYENAISEYTLAIEMDPHFAEHAHYNRGYAYIANYGGNATENKDFIDKAIDDLKTARTLIGEREHNLHLMQYASEGEVFSKQISDKLSLYNIQRSAIDLAIGPDINSIDQKIKEYEDVQKRPEMASDDLEKISEAIKKLKDQKKTIGVIQKAQSNKRDLNIEIIKMKNCLSENDQLPDNQITEFERNGAIGGFRISEIPPINWVSVIGLLLLGLGQLVAGAALTVFTLGGGASFGMGLITEGISDIVTAVKDGIINRDFDWARWAIEKAISLVVSVACAGWKAMKDVAKTAYAGVKNAASIGSKVVTQTVKEGWKMVAQKVAYDLAKGVAKDVVSNLANYGVSQTIIPLIQEKLIELLQGPIEQALKTNPSVKIMLKLDQECNNQHYENRIMAMGMELLKPGSSRDVFDLVGIAQKIGNRIADNKIPGLSAFRQVTDALKAVEELSTLTGEFINKLNKAIDNEAKRDKVEQKLENISENTNQPQEIEEQKSAPQKDVHGDIDLNLCQEEDEQAKLQKTPRDVGRMSESFVNVISTTMVNSIQQKLINPIVQGSVNYSIDYMTSGATRSLNERVETYRSHKRIIHHQNKGFSKIKAKEERNTAEKKQRIDKVKGLINDVRSGGPSGLVHLGAASDAIDRPIEVYDPDGKLKYVIGDTKQGSPAKIQYHEPKSGENIGHYTLLGNKEPIKSNANANMCLYNVLAEQTGHDPNELKNSSLQIMENNKHYMAKQVDDITRLEMYSQLRLAIGGAEYKGKCPEDAYVILDKSSGTRGFKKRNPGHPLHHVSARGTDQTLEETSKELNRKIIMHDENGEVIYSKGPDDLTKTPIELEYDKSLVDPNDDNLFVRTSTTYNEIINDPNIIRRCFDPDVGWAPDCKPDELTSAVRNTVNNIPINGTACVENYSIGGSKTGFISQTDMNYVLHKALNSASAITYMNQLNTRPVTQKNSRRVLNINLQSLGISRTIYGQEWTNGNPTGKIKPVVDVTILLQHHNGQENNATYPVHIQTMYPQL
ncbi:uncharacterized protein LOC143208734 [Lasioglossum baleicum]|uniref:uncharacterized protein LOC143208734 n=1 Tax=Lasioglossum baleicum TaxID=434251 RepID=UPI003FCDB6AB